MQLPLFPLPSDWRATPVAELPDWTAKRIGIDTETFDPHLKETGPSVRTGGFVAGVSFAFEDGPSYYLPLRHSEDNLPYDETLRYLRAQARSYTGTLVGANLNYDLDYLANLDVTFPQLARQRDVQIADPLLNELHNSYSLDAIAKRWGLPGKDEILLRQSANHYGVDPKKDIWKLPGRHVGPYAEQDASLPLRILRKQERAIDEQELWVVYDLECQLQPVLLKMRRRGVRVDEQRLEEIAAWALQQEQQDLDSIAKATGVAIPVDGIWKKKYIALILQTLGVKIKLTDKGNPRLDKETLKGIEHPIMTKILDARTHNKLRTTFVQSIRNHMVDGRIHCTFNQLRNTRELGDEVGARYGRMSSEHPNLQQQPARGPFAKRWRSIYRPDTDIWFAADYSQQEPRILTHYAELCGLPKATEAAEKYRTDPKTDNHAMMTRLVHPETSTWGDKEPRFLAKRTPCKNIYLGLCYGMGGAKLARELALPTQWIENRAGERYEVAGPEAQALLDAFDQRVPYVRGLARYCERIARERGYIRTLLGRRCRFPKKRDGTYDWTHKALNRLIQGSAADQTKLATIELDKAAVTLQLQVHDELGGSLVDPEQGKLISEIMRHCVELTVPSRVDLEVGPSWGEVT